MSELHFNLSYTEARKEMDKGRYAVATGCLIQNRLLYRVYNKVLECKFMVEDEWSSSNCRLDDLQGFNWAIIPDDEKYKFDKKGEKIMIKIYSPVDVKDKTVYLKLTEVGNVVTLTTVDNNGVYIKRLLKFEGNKLCLDNGFKNKGLPFVINENTGTLQVYDWYGEKKI